MKWVYGVVLTALLLAFEISSQVTQDNLNSTIAPTTNGTNLTGFASTADGSVSASVTPTVGSTVTVTFNSTSGSIPGMTAGNPLLLLALLLVVPVYALFQ